MSAPVTDAVPGAADRGAPDEARVDALADVADVVMSVARKIHALTAEEPDAIALTPLEALAMQHIDRHPGITPSEFAAELSLKSSNASAVLRELERKGLIRRESDPADRRTVRVTATAKASANLVRVRATWARLLSALPLDAARLEEITEALRAVEKDLSERRHSRS